VYIGPFGANILQEALNFCNGLRGIQEIQEMQEIQDIHDFRPRTVGFVIS
jgi:hypothetical protein